MKVSSRQNEFNGDLEIVVTVEKQEQAMMDGPSVLESAMQLVVEKIAETMTINYLDSYGDELLSKMDSREFHEQVKYAIQREIAILRTKQYKHEFNYQMHPKQREFMEEKDKFFVFTGDRGNYRRNERRSDEEILAIASQIAKETK
jgi:hypothetical protein